MRSLTLALLGILVTACSSLDWHDSLESLPASRPAVTGRVRVLFRGAEATRFCKIGFRGDGPSYRLDDTGRVAYRLPPGPNEISSLACTRAGNTEHWRFLRPGELVLDVADAPSATYFGDVVVRWEAAGAVDGGARALSSFGGWTEGQGNLLEALSGSDPLEVEVSTGSVDELVGRLGFTTGIVIRPLRVAPHLVVSRRGTALP